MCYNVMLNMMMEEWLITQGATEWLITQDAVFLDLVINIYIL